jgi:hypothetical protein
MVLPASSGLLYWSNTFQINRKVDSSYGTKIKDQKKEKAKAEKEIAESRTWKADEGEFTGLFQSAEEGLLVIKVDKDEKAHKAAEKGRKWTTASGSVVKATLVERKKNQVKLERAKDNFIMVLKKKDISEADQKFLERLKWDGEKTKTIPIETLSPGDQQLVRAATGMVKARKGKGRELRISQPFASMRLKAGLSFIQFLHGRVYEDNSHSITDRVTGTNSIGFYAKVEGITDTKNTKAYLQLNVSGSGFKAYSLGLEHNVYKMVNLGVDLALYPNNSFIEFQDNRSDPESKWKWYPGSRPDEQGKGGGSLIIAPYLTVNF